LVFDDSNFSEFETVLLSDLMAHTPPEVVAKNFGVSEKALANMPKKERFIFQAELPGPLEEDRRRAAGTLAFLSLTLRSAPCNIR
jgi:oxalate decarboxylase